MIHQDKCIECLPPLLNEWPQKKFLVYGQSNCYLRIIKHNFICNSLSLTHVREEEKNVGGKIYAESFIETTCRNGRKMQHRI